MGQNYSNHRRWVPLYHFVLSITLLALVILSLINAMTAIGTEGFNNAGLIFVLTTAVFILFFFTRTFALKAQDKAIRAEENLRHFVLTGKCLDSKLTMRQIIGLRFAPDDELLDLANKAVTENLSEEDIKKGIKNWKGDTDRA
jgi:hypothetical protein